MPLYFVLHKAPYKTKINKIHKLISDLCKYNGHSSLKFLFYGVFSRSFFDGIYLTTESFKMYESLYFNAFSHE